MSLEFYREKNLEKVEAGGVIFEIPKDWEMKRLIDLADYINGYAFSPKDWKSEGFPIIRIQNLNDEQAEFNYFDGEIDDKYIVEDGDLLFSWSASIGVYVWRRGKAVLNQHIFKVIPKNDVDRFYFYYVLFLAIEQLKGRVHGSTMKHFKRGELKTTFVPLPPLSEQRKIAHVLTTINKAIEEVDKAIKKAERIKKGLMQELLTKGIGHKEFKETEIGRIPKKWKVVNFERASIKIIDGDRGVNYPKSGELLEKGYCLFLNARNVTKEGFKFEETNFISKEKDCSLGKGKLKRGDVVLTTRGTIGNVAYYDESIPYEHVRINSGMVILRNTNPELETQFLYLLLKSSIVQNYIKRISYGTAQPQLNIKIIKSFKIPLPPLEEQRKIAEILSKWDKVIKLKKTKKEKLERMKKKVMELLLTGKVRIKRKA